MTARLILMLSLFLSTTGCAAFIDAGFRELDDHGKHARYENKSYLGHVLDAATEPEERCDETTVVVHHRHRR